MSQMSLQFRVEFFSDIGTEWEALVEILYTRSSFGSVGSSHVYLVLFFVVLVEVFLPA